MFGVGIGCRVVGLKAVNWSMPTSSIMMKRMFGGFVAAGAAAAASTKIVARAGDKAIRAEDRNSFAKEFMREQP